MLPVRVAAAALLVALVLPVAARATGPAKVYLEDTVPRAGSSSVTFTTHRPASFRVLLRVPTAGRAKLFLTGAHAPKGGGPLIQTSNTAPSPCQGAAGSFYCRASYEPLPKGTYTWRIVWRGQQPAHVELTVRW
jgi:hypothetical protein